jgi:hypothetical protein
VEKVVEWRSAKVPSSQIPELLDLEASSERATMEAGYSMPQYLAWAIPLLGFIGTIVGVSRAMAAAELVGSPERVLQLLARSRVTGEIAVAFDTTLVALVLSLVGVWFISVTERRERELQERAKVFALSVVATPVAVRAADDKAKRLRRLETERAEALSRLRRLRARHSEIEADGRVIGAQAALYEVRLSHAKESAASLERRIESIERNVERLDEELGVASGGAQQAAETADGGVAPPAVEIPRRLS